MLLRTVEESKLPRRKIVPTRDGNAIREQAIDKVGSDEPGGAGDEGILHEQKELRR